MSALEELSSLLASGSRVIMIAQHDVDLRGSAPDNSIFLLKIGEGSLAAGGRGGGFGERKVVKTLLFELRGGTWSKLFETDEPKASEFEVPYYVSRLPFTLRDGTESIGYGVVEPDLVRQMRSKTSSPSSA